jgi:hypothetical protein
MDISRHRLVLIATALIVVVIALALNRVARTAREDFVELVPEPSASPVVKGQTYALLEGKATVSADVLEDGFWIARLVVRGPGAEYASETYGFETEHQRKSDFVESLRRQIGWKDGVLFVPHSCGGGNAWRCNLQLLYRIDDGKLVELGAVKAGLEGHPIGNNLVDGYIEDDFDLLENNSLTSHAAAPGFTIVLRITPKGLVVDAERTWERNIFDYRANEERLGCEGPGCELIVDPEERASMALHMAALAKYTDRDDELAVALALAEKTLDPAGFEALKKELAAVVPGALMTSFKPERPPPTP